MANVGGFFKNVMSEMRKVSWPKEKRTYKIYCCSVIYSYCNGYIFRYSGFGDFRTIPLVFRIIKCDMIIFIGK